MKFNRRSPLLRYLNGLTGGGINLTHLWALLLISLPLDLFVLSIPVESLEPFQRILIGCLIITSILSLITLTNSSTESISLRLLFLQTKLVRSSLALKILAGLTLGTGLIEIILQLAKLKPFFWLIFIIPIFIGGLKGLKEFKKVREETIKKVDNRLNMASRYYNINFALTVLFLFAIRGLCFSGLLLTRSYSGHLNSYLAWLFLTILILTHFKPPKFFKPPFCFRCRYFILAELPKGFFCPACKNLRHTINSKNTHK